MPRYARWLERALRERGHQVTLVRPQPFFARLSRHPARIKYLGYLDKFLLFPLRLRRMSRDFDLVHVLDHSNSMYLKDVRNTPSVITCHDVLAIRSARGDFPNVSVGWSGRLLQRWILSGLRAARNVICVSEKTSVDLRALAENDGQRQRTIYNALNWDFRPGLALPADLAARVGVQTGERYILHVGNNNWYKNRVGLLRIFARLVKNPEYSDLRLILAGAPPSSEMEAVVAQKGLEERIVRAIRISNHELQALYCNAHALLFPSHEEGFGWPILEAQASGCPVITTGRPPMTEVAGEAAILIDSNDPVAAAATIADGLRRRDSLREAGFRNLARFDEQKIVDGYCAFYADVLESEKGKTGERTADRAREDDSAAARTPTAR